MSSAKFDEFEEAAELTEMVEFTEADLREEVGLDFLLLTESIGVSSAVESAVGSTVATADFLPAPVTGID